MIKDFDKAAILEELLEDEDELHRDEQIIKTSFVIIAFFILGIIGSVSYLFIKAADEKKSVTTVINKIIHESIPTATVLSPTPTPETASPTGPVVINSTSTQSTAIKDNYINIGSGTNESKDWTDVVGAITTVDIDQYQNIKDVYLEASINVPTANGTVSVRLYNGTDKHPVWNSEVTRNGTTDTYLFISPALAYDLGPKMYSIQMKSQLGVKANLVQSRIHVVTK